MRHENPFFLGKRGYVKQQGLQEGQDQGRE
jgi:hypothetical protein